MEFLYFLEGLRTPLLDSFFSAVTHLGSETAFLAIAIVVFWCADKKRGYYLFTAGFFGTILNQFLKLTCRVPRPWVKDPAFTIVEAARADATGYSFPSGHTQAVMAALGCPARFTKRVWLRAVCILGIVLTALSRMYLGVHTPADVGVSLVIGTVLVFALYPLFEASETRPGILYAVVGAIAVSALAFLLYVENGSWPADIDPHNLQSAIKTGWRLFGCSLGMLVAYTVERRYIRFDPRAPLPAQVLKCAVGLALVLALKAGLKPVMNVIFGGHMAAYAVRYFCIVVFAACIWPMTFRYFAKLGKQ